MIEPPRLRKANHVSVYYLDMADGRAAAPASTFATESALPKKDRNWLSEATFIAAIPVAIYLVTFQFNAGRADFFGIPHELITINLKSVALAAPSLQILGGALFLLSVFAFGFWSYGKRDHPVYRRVVILFPTLVMGIVSIALTVFAHWKTALLSLGLTGLLVFVILGLPILIRREPTWVKRIEEHDKLQRSDSVISYYLRQELGVLFVGAIWVTLISQLAYSVGRFTAENQVEFFVRSSSPETVVIAIYDDYLVTARFTRDKKTVEKSLTVIKIAESPSTSLRSERVGPLRPEE